MANRSHGSTQFGLELDQGAKSKGLCVLHPKSQQEGVDFPEAIPRYIGRSHQGAVLGQGARILVSQRSGPAAKSSCGQIYRPGQC